MAQKVRKLSIQWTIAREKSLASIRLSWKPTASTGSCRLRKVKTQIAISNSIGLGSAAILSRPFVKWKQLFDRLSRLKSSEGPCSAHVWWRNRIWTWASASTHTESKANNTRRITNISSLSRPSSTRQPSHHSKIARKCQVAQVAATSPQQTGLTLFTKGNQSNPNRINSDPSFLKRCFPCPSKKVEVIKAIITQIKWLSRIVGLIIRSKTTLKIRIARITQGARRWTQISIRNIRFFSTIAISVTRITTNPRRQSATTRKKEDPRSHRKTWRSSVRKWIRWSQWKMTAYWPQLYLSFRTLKTTIYLAIKIKREEPKRPSRWTLVNLRQILRWTQLVQRIEMRR